MRAITDQLNADFAGVISEPKGKIRFKRDAESYEDNKLHYIGTEDVNNKIGSDSILFFANGDFQSTGQYDYEGTEKTVTGTAACIYYGLAEVEGYSDTEKLDPKKKVLVRRQTIITGDDRWEPDNELDALQEYCKESLAYLIADSLFDANDLMEPPPLDTRDEVDLSMYMAKGVDDFTIQFDEWDSISDKLEWVPIDETEFSKYENERIVARALKFSFKIYDSRGVIEKGRRFSHIVYLLD